MCGRDGATVRKRPHGRTFVSIRSGGWWGVVSLKKLRSWQYGPVALLLVLTACTAGSEDPAVSTTAMPTITTVTLPPATTTTAPPAATTTTTTLPAELPGVVVSPDDDLAQLVEASEPGTRFVLSPGIHRDGPIEPKDDMSFIGQEGAILSGAIILEGFVASGDTWTLSGVSLNDDEHGKCEGEYRACALQNDLFMDDTMVWRVDEADEVGPGTWWGGGDTVIVGDDPNQRKVELSVVEHAFISSADDISIESLIVEKYATRAQSGTIQAQEPGNGDFGARWLLQDLEVRFNHAVGIKAGEETTIRRVESHHNGQLGIAASGGTNVLVELTEIHHNNTRGFDSGWEGGGTKFTYTNGLIVRNNEVHHNLGPGLWTDIDCYDTLYEGNRSYANTGPGIFHEISFDAVIRNNEVYENGFGQTSWLWGAGILIAASTDVEVVGNSVYDNADGIAGIQQNRERSDGSRSWLLRNLWVHNNTIVMPTGQTGVVQDVDDPSIFSDRNLRFDSNTYSGPEDKAFAWNNDDISWREWRAAGQDQNGQHLDG